MVVLWVSNPPGESGEGPAKKMWWRRRDVGPSNNCSQCDGKKRVVTKYQNFGCQFLDDHKLRPWNQQVNKHHEIVEGPSHSARCDSSTWLPWSNSRPSRESTLQIAQFGQAPLSDLNCEIRKCTSRHLPIANWPFPHWFGDTDFRSRTEKWLPRKPQTNWATLNVSLLSPCEFFFLAAGSFVIVLASYNSRHDTEHCWGFPAWMQELISKAFPKHCSNWPVVSPGLCGCVEQVAEGHPMVTAKDGLMWIESGMFQMFHILQLYTVITCKKWNLSGKTYFWIPKSPKISGEVPSHRFHLMAESIIIGEAFHQGLGILMPL